MAGRVRGVEELPNAAHLKLVSDKGLPKKCCLDPSKKDYSMLGSPYLWRLPHPSTH